MNNKAGQSNRTTASGITWCKSGATVGASVSHAAKNGKVVRLLLLLFALKVASFAQPTPPSFFARPDALGTGCGDFGNLLVGDLNGDGIPDIACNLPVLLGNGDGTFRLGQDIDGSLNAYHYGALTDLNGDGDLDIVFPEYENGLTPDQIGVLLGNGNGTFQKVVLSTSSVIDTGEFTVGVADFNGDGVPDVVELGTAFGVVFFGSGNGSFTAGPGFAVNSNQRTPLSPLFVADMNKDGKPDLVALYGDNELVVLLGNGDGTFQAPIDTALPFPKDPFAIAMAVGDVNGDGIPDVAVTNNTDTVVLLGKGDGSFESSKLVDLPGGDYGLTLADVNGDGILDLINNAVQVAFGKGDGTFKRPIYWPVTPQLGSLTAVVAADLGNDGRTDLITTDFAFFSVLMNTGKGEFKDGIRTAIPGGDVSCAATGDFNGDGVPDIAAVNATGVQIMLGTGKATKPFQAGEAYPVTEALCPLVGDLNGDGIVDLFVPTGSYGGAGSVVAYLGNGDGTFRLGPTSAVSNVQTFALGDFNGDGKLDYATTSNLLAYGNGDGSFGTPNPYIPSISPNALGFSDIVAADLNGDGKPDLVLDDYQAFDGQYLYVLLNEGAAGWSETQVPTDQFLSLLTVGALERNGKLDIVAALPLGLCVFLNNGAGSLSQETCLDGYFDAGGYPLAADVNGDGVPDLILAVEGDMAVFPGEGGAQYPTSPVFYGMMNSPVAAFALNTHHQSPKRGTPDLVEVDGSGVIVTLINETK